MYVFSTGPATIIYDAKADHMTSCTSVYLFAMERCPPEICSRIYALACVDDGTTGRALSLVSKYINETSKHTKFQSIAVRSLTQALAFADLLEQSPPGEHRVCHLFISMDPEHSIYKAKRMSSVSSTLKRIHSLLSGLRRTMGRKQRGGRAHPFKNQSLSGVALTRILTAVAPCLRTLSIAIQSYGISAFRQGNQAIPSLPALHELTIGFYSGNFNRSEDILTAFTSLPNLRRLNLEWLRVAINPSLLLERVLKLAPSLTHLRLPTLSPIAIYGESRVLPPLPSMLEMILVQPPPLPCPDLDYQEEAVDWSALLALKDDRVIQLRPSYLEWNWPPNTIEKDWSERLNGGEGCWDLYRSLGIRCIHDRQGEPFYINII
jgi:hypothetical protein